MRKGEERRVESKLDEALARSRASSGWTAHGPGYEYEYESNSNGTKGKILVDLYE